MPSSKSRKWCDLSRFSRKALIQLRDEHGVDVSKHLARLDNPLLPAVTTPSSRTPGAHKYAVSAKDMRTFDGITFDSKLEMSAYKVLKERQVTFTRQPLFVLQEGFRDTETGKFIRPIQYEADFVLTRPSDGVQFIVDTKGMETPLFLLKRKMALAKGHRIHCVKSPSELVVFLVENRILSR